MKYGKLANLEGPAEVVSAFGNCVCISHNVIELEIACWIPEHNVRYSKTDTIVDGRTYHI